MGQPAHKWNPLAGVFGSLRRWLAEWTASRRPSRGAPRHSFGRRSERLAERHLKSRGYRIVARNFRAAGAEIDLVALDGDTLVFVEVKARRSTAAGTPAEAVDERKQRRLRRAASVFAARRRADGRPMRFDVVAIRGEGRGRTLEHLRNAF
jgi:putative endonuclease